ncbi:MAG: hypothetical protein V1844_01225 [Pseudomonadota bacterium]
MIELYFCNNRLLKQMAVWTTEDYWEEPKKFRKEKQMRNLNRRVRKCSVQNHGGSHRSMPRRKMMALPVFSCLNFHNKISIDRRFDFGLKKQVINE